jgi:general secretion pathway protein C
MQQLSFDRSNIAQTAVIIMVTIAALALFALVAAYWTWEWLAPSPQPRAQAAANVDHHSLSASNLFGHLERVRVSSAPPVRVAIRLLGIAAVTTGQHGYAVMQLEPTGILVAHEGEDIAPGVRLAEVGNNHVILERAGARETLAWPEKITSAESATPRINK